MEGDKYHCCRGFQSEKRDMTNLKLLTKVTDTN